MTSFTSSFFTDSILRAMRDFQAPGLALAVIKDDRVLFARGYGVRDLDTAAAVDEHTTFAIASISKSFTTTALAMLVDEGRLSWDDLVTEILPGFQLADPFASREMRVRDLLIHNSGLPEVSGGTIWYGSDFNREEVLYRLRYLSPNASFRSRYAYQNVLYLAAGQLIPRLTAMTWDHFVQERIFSPLGMCDSSPNLARSLSNPNRATPYSNIPYSTTGPIGPISYRDHDNVGPAASIHASAWDLAQYLRLHLNRGAYDSQVLFNAQTAAELHSPQITIPNGQYPTVLLKAAPRFTAYGLGWRVQDYRGRKLVQHSGGVDGMRTLVTMLPEEGLGVVALTNMETSLTYPVTFQVLDRLLKESDYDWAGSYLQTLLETREKKAAAEAARNDAHQPGSAPLLPLEAYTGRYPSPLVDFLEVTLEDSGLTLQFPHTPAFTARLDPWHYNTFRLTWLDPYIPWGLVTFSQDSAGRVNGLNLDQPNLLDVDFSELGPLKKA